MLTACKKTHQVSHCFQRPQHGFAVSTKDLLDAQIRRTQSHKTLRCVTGFSWSALTANIHDLQHRQQVVWLVMIDDRMFVGSDLGQKGGTQSASDDIIPNYHEFLQVRPQHYPQKAYGKSFSQCKPPNATLGGSKPFVVQYILLITSLDELTGPASSDPELLKIWFSVFNFVWYQMRGHLIISKSISQTHRDVN